MKYTYNYPQPSITGDVIVWDRRADKILLIKRKGEPFAGCWAIVGGFFNSETNGENIMDESVRDAAIRELKEEIGIDFKAKVGKYIVERWSQYKLATGQMSHDKDANKEFNRKEDAEEYMRTADSGISGDTRYRYVLREPPHKLSLSFLTVQDKPGRDPRGRVVTLVYVLAIWDGLEGVNIQAGDDAAEYAWFSKQDIVDGKVPLAFDHLDSIKKFAARTTYV